MALPWLLKNPTVTAPIIGPRRMQWLTGSLRVMGIRLDDAALTRLDEISPGPAGQAPKTYTW